MSSVPETLLRGWSLSNSGERYGWTRRSASFVEVKDQAIQKLQDQLRQVGQELRLKGKEQKQLESLRDQLECQIDDLTANLFEKANKMVVDANVTRMDAEEELKQAQSKVLQLQTDILALKTLISCNTEPEVQEATCKPRSSSSVKKKFSFKNMTRFPKNKSQPNMSLDSPSSDGESMGLPCSPYSQPSLLENMEGLDEFKMWRECPELNESCTFIAHLIANDVQPCLNFISSELQEIVLKDVVSNSLSIEPVKGEGRQSRYCELIKAEVDCSHVVKVSGLENSLYINQGMRDKIWRYSNKFSC
ncbi:rab-3A-interacting protein-like isoform X2 [Watersipora subatra]|uniref:rab-3A-interacting protein-like isoform X2 n=1 Tax=Watersipora subatra TaxID=2589382 RepID=UPI00355C3EA6